MDNNLIVFLAHPNELLAELFRGEGWSVILSMLLEQISVRLHFFESVIFQMLSQRDIVFHCPHVIDIAKCKIVLQS